MGLLDAIKILSSSFKNDGGCDWFCDECDAFLNDQPGFAVTSGRWLWKECGDLNDVAENNVIDISFDDDDDDDYDDDEYDYIFYNGEDEDYDEDFDYEDLWARASSLTTNPLCVCRFGRKNFVRE